MVNLNEYNILCLGTTGYGKTTSLNALGTYLNYATFEDARNAEELPILSCVRFSFSAENHQPMNVCLGEDENERFYGDSQASTLEPKKYRFEHNGSVFNFIDVPGSADPRGLDQDDYNNKLILDAIGSMENLHTICLFVRGDEQRLTPQVEYCLNEAFTKLHKANIIQVVFIFTYTRGGHYRPGGALVTLREYFERLQQKGVTISIQPNNAYCVDNIAFKGLCLLQAHPEATDYINVEEYKRCYEVSRNAMLRLLQDIPQKNQLETITTLSVNEARMAVICLIEPLAAISNAIQANEQNLQDNENEIQAQLIEHGVHEEYDIKKYDLEKPATVCTSKTCSQQVPIGPERDEMVTIYPQTCHSPCFQPGVTLSLIGDECLKKCEAFEIDWKKSGRITDFPDEGKCRYCKCSYKLHQHIKTEYRRSIRENRIPPTNEQGAQEFIDQRKRDLEREQHSILRAMATFGAYLKANAIISYNTAFPQYIQIQIEKEQAARNFQQVRRLQELLEKFQREELIIHSTETEGANRRVIDAEHVSGVIEELFTLSINGTRIQELYENERSLNRQNIERTAINAINVVE